MREKIQRFMIGRYGADELAKAQSIAALVLLTLWQHGYLSYNLSGFSKYLAIRFCRILRNGLPLIR